MRSGFGRAHRALAGLLAMGAAAVIGFAVAAPVSNIAVTPHNLSRSGQTNTLSNVRADATGPTEICAFCHTPHGANTNIKGPLWNRSASNATYTRYTSASLDANTIGDGFVEQPMGSSLLCLSCHDGMVALGNVNVLNGAPAAITLQNTEAGKMPSGAGAYTGFTRNLGVDMSNDHPISITYDDRLAMQDGEMTRMTGSPTAVRDRLDGTLIGMRSNGYRPKLPLEPTGPGGTGQVQCATCHDPHIAGDNKFLRLKRFQSSTPTGGTFNEDRDQICLACHPKLGMAWAESAHANPIVADEAYRTESAKRRGFPTGTTVWQAACLNCHDTHTVQGSRRLLREGVDSGLSGNTTDGFFRSGSPFGADTVSALENTCYQCHDASSATSRVISSSPGSTVPDIRTDFGKTFRMPITTYDQLKAKKEPHNILDADFIETRENLGRYNWENRHVECTDCHNPHRARRASKFYERSATSGEGAKRTHNVGGREGNVASGVLRGTWGVEPVFGPTSSTWPQNPIEYIVKKGDPGENTSTDRNKSYLTREYQLCFKCHSSYANGDNKADYPALGNTLGTTLGDRDTRNRLTRYTNVAGEFGSVRATDPPSSGTDQGEYANGTLNMGTACSGGDCAPAASYPNGVNADTNNAYNHRSWHPVMWPTGRDRKERRMNDSGAINLLAPFAANIGIQTMHCSDCHASESSWTANVGPNTETQGPHGSNNKFILRGPWNPANPSQINIQTITPTNSICGKCHYPKNSSGLNGSIGPHVPDGNMGQEECHWCHISLPHGWRNKAFLANLRCVGPEGGAAGGCDNIGGTGDEYGPINRPPYYLGVRLRVWTWARSGNWGFGSCSNGSDSMKECDRSDTD